MWASASTSLASYADCYINDAFGTAHRAHASTALIAEYFPQDKMFGYLMEKEIAAIENVLKNARHRLRLRRILLRVLDLDRNGRGGVVFLDNRGQEG